VTLRGCTLGGSSGGCWRDPGVPERAGEAGGNQRARRCSCLPGLAPAGRRGSIATVGCDTARKTPGAAQASPPLHCSYDSLGLRRDPPESCLRSAHEATQSLVSWPLHPRSHPWHRRGVRLVSDGCQMGVKSDSDGPHLPLQASFSSSSSDILCWVGPPSSPRGGRASSSSSMASPAAFRRKGCFFPVLFSMANTSECRVGAISRYRWLPTTPTPEEVDSLALWINSKWRRMQRVPGRVCPLISDYYHIWTECLK
jgi:hypothetical protein